MKLVMHSEEAFMGLECTGGKFDLLSFLKLEIMRTDFISAILQQDPSWTFRRPSISANEFSIFSDTSLFQPT